MTTITATQSGKIGPRRTNKWTEEESLLLVYLREHQKLIFRKIAEAISERRQIEGNIRPPITLKSVETKYYNLKRKQKQNESNT